jgi:hypothetical protein
VGIFCRDSVGVALACGVEAGRTRTLAAAADIRDAVKQGLNAISDRLGLLGGGGLHLVSLFCGGRHQKWRHALLIFLNG